MPAKKGALTGEKKVKGRKRHIITDIMGNMLIVKVHAANIHDTMSGCHVYQSAKNKYPDIEGACGDEGYKGTFVDFVETNEYSFSIRLTINQLNKTNIKHYTLKSLICQVLIF